MDPQTTSAFYGLQQKGKNQIGSIYISTVFQVFNQVKKSPSFNRSITFWGLDSIKRDIEKIQSYENF